MRLALVFSVFATSAIGVFSDFYELPLTR